MEARMERTDVDHYRSKLDQVRGALVKAYARKRLGGREPGDGHPQDLADKATSSHTKELLYSLGSNERSVLVEVDRALARMREELYGTCVECEEKISGKRLEAVRWARLCVSCQQHADQEAQERLIA